MEINKKIPVAILGATGMVGQRFVQQLANHPWFKISALASSLRSAGKPYQEACRWLLEGDMPSQVARMMVQPVKPNLDAKIIFSALPASVARDVEPLFAEAGYAVCSNASAFRYEQDVPVIIPEINHDHIALLEAQKKNRGWKGLLVTSPNCTTTGIALPLKPLQLAFGIKKIFAVTMQAVSGAGYPGISFLDIEDNVIPFIGGEEKKIETETHLLLGKMNGSLRIPARITISAQANRVSVKEGHTICLSLEFDKKPSLEEITLALKNFRGIPGTPQLPSMPEQIIIVREEKDRPQPRKDREVNGGMSISVGRIRPCPIIDYRMVTVSHNTLRGAASGSILNAELLVAKKLVK
ncbi:MAG: aspartate-semialdehyde dehydrogenase [Anaerolineaceae bacterium]|nr:aspartate-semialdehyde dehydrogenase [Anaerolineaceae bacterium]